MARRRNRSYIKFLRARLLLDDLRSLLRGWYFRMTPRKVEVSEQLLQRHVLSEVSVKINWREELKEINYSRIHNMGLGCELVSQVNLRPGEVFSLKRFFRGTTEEQGFQKGPMFMRGRTDYVAGGGTCLISTLLFNAALKANLSILEKHNHSTDLWGEDRFIDLGLDATYVFGRKDLKFKNTHTADILIIAELVREDLMLHCRFISSKPLPYKVSVTTEIVEELRPDDYPDTSASAEARPYRKGWVVMTNRFIKGHDNVERNTYTKRERYKPYLLKTQQ
ncbi:VanW family protein [Cohnella abietis]|uniref:Vancomycin resistance protein n=1 Tax=Cohnella abietis TaxID=2507935 RepID=A0A3T1D159_9BACL|nr:VanW family protein [Cohnella abietis]BBI31852.1 hypothetical protein KCTCHS21_12510 [Cohnella abietis]